MTQPWRLRREPLPGAPPWEPLARAWDLSPQAGRLAWLRGASRPEDLAWRLDPSWERTTDPFLLHGMGRAVARIRLAVARQEVITVYGDYDVDGVTAVALLTRVLERLGAKVNRFIPNRFSDGYGLSMDCIREVVARDAPGLMISVDCGVRSLEEVEASRALGVAWVITDHHALGPDLPGAEAVVHPGLDDHPNPHLAGVGVAFKLAQALLDAVPRPTGPDVAFLDALLKLVAIGTVADMVPLVGENALLVKRGLEALGGANGPGLAGLLRAARAEGAVRGHHLGFGVGPRLNAVGRMGGADDAVRLLLSRDPVEAGLLLEQVERLNGERRATQKELQERLAPPGPEPFDLVVDAGAHKGVIGIVAGHRVRASGRPSAVCTVQDGVAQCSVRAPEGYDLSALLEQARIYLLTGGGHRLAAGMTFELPRLSFVRESLRRGALAQAQDLGPRILAVDGEGTGLVPAAEELLALEPFGQGFPEPLVVVRGPLDGPPKPFGQGHVKFRIRGDRETFTWFSGAGPLAAAAAGGELVLAVAPMDEPRWGRSWKVEERLEAPAP
jgi:single-stranded-DNA-specific exonuclease